MERSLIKEFFRNELASYREPQRQGTPRGERIGFSTVKYHASLLALLNNDLREQSGLLGISYGLLRKWRTEPEFKKVVNGHCDKFTVIFFKHLLEVAYESRNKQDEFLKKPLDEIASSKLPDTSYNWGRISDCLGYSGTLNNKIGQVIDNIFSQKVNFVKKKGIIKNEDEFVKLTFVVLFFYWDLSGYFNDTSIKHRDMIDRQWRMMSSNILRIIKDTLLKPEITEEDRKQALYALTILDR
jgi:hypothetical protein